jgi:uncharacterized protein (TIGR02145 family)
MIKKILWSMALICRGELRSPASVSNRKMTVLYNYDSLSLKEKSSMNFFIRQGRALLLVAAVIGAVGLAGCGDDNGVNSGNVKSVTIGGKKWMNKNVNIETENSWCYENSADSCAKYGRLYTWEAAKAVCPLVGSGWRLPTREEWGELAIAAGGTGTYGTGGTAGKKLKSKSGWKSDGNGTDDYDFSALPGGGYYGGSFNNAGEGGYWWTATEDDSSRAYDWGMRYGNDYVDEYWNSKNYGFSVRCVRD